MEIEYMPLGGGRFGRVKAITDVVFGPTHKIETDAHGNEKPGKGPEGATVDFAGRNLPVDVQDPAAVKALKQLVGL